MRASKAQALAVSWVVASAGCADDGDGAGTSMVLARVHRVGDGATR